MRKKLLIISLITLNLPMLLLRQAGFGLLPHIMRFSITIKNITSGSIIAVLLPFYIAFMCGINCFAQPVISYSPDSFNVTLSGCNDSITLPLTIYNTGSANLDFDVLEGVSSPVAEFDFAYITNSSDNTVSVFDVTTNTLVGVPISVGLFPWRVTIKPDGKFVYVSNRDGNSISVIRTSDNTVVATIPVGSGPTGLAFTPDGNFAYVGNRWIDNVMVIDCNTNTVINTITSFGNLNQPQDIVITPDGQFAYVATFGDGVTVIAVGPDTVLVNIPGVVSFTQSIRISPDGSTVYVTEGDGGSRLQIIDIATNTLITTMLGFINPHGFDITPDGNYIYVIEKGTNVIDIIDVSTNTVINSIADPIFSFDAWGLSISPDGNYAYVTVKLGSPALVIIDLNTNTVVGNEILPGNDSKGIATLKGGVPWLAKAPITGTIVPGDSAIIGVTFYASGLNSGTYSVNLFINSNDSTSLVDTIPCTLTIVGAPVLALSDTCLDLDSVMEGGTNTASLWVINTGCDTLFVSSMTTSTSEFSPDTNALMILPNDSAEMIVSFSPLSPGSYTDNLNIFSNDADTSVCLSGVGTPAPAISFDPDSFNVTLNVCNDSITLPLTIYNTGAINLDFNVSTVTYSPPYKYAYIVNSDDNSVSVLDLNTNTLVGSPIPVGSFPWRVSIKPDTRYVYVSNRNSNNITVIRTSDNTVTATIPVGSRPTGLAFTPDGNFAYVGNRTSDNVMVIDCNTNTVVNTIFTSMLEPQDIAITPDGKYAYVANAGSGVTVIEIGPDTVVANMGGTWEGAHSVAITPDGQYVYVTENWNGNVLVISTATNTIIDNITISGFGAPQGLDITPDGNFVYVVNTWNDQIDIIDVNTNTIVNTIPDTRFNNRHWGLAISPIGDYAYVTNPYGSPQTLMIIDLSTNTVISDLNSGNGSRDIATLRGGVPWLSSSPVAGTVVPGDSAIINVQFNGYGLNTGIYTGDIIVNSNDPNSPHTVPATFTINGYPILVLSDSCLDLDSIFQGETNTQTLRFFNTGCDTLFITNITNSLSEFSVDTTSLTVMPGDTGEVIVSFSPLSVGSFLDTLNILNNDADTTVCISGVGTPPPIISVNPDTISITLVCNDSITDTLKVYNSGSNDLTFNICSGGSGIGLDIILNNLNQNFTNITSVIPSRYDFIDGVSGTNISDGGGDMYDGGNYLWTNLGGAFNYSDNLIVSDPGMGPSGQYFTRKYTGLFVFAADLDSVDWFEITGDLGADGSGNADATILTTEICGSTYKGFVKRVFNAGDPSVNHLIIVEEHPAIIHTWATNTNDDQHRVSNLTASPTSRLYYLLYASSGGGYIDDNATLNIMTEFLNAINSFPGWLSLSVTSDTVVPGDSSIIEMQFNSTGLIIGQYTTEIYISSNDPVNSPTIVPVILSVTGFPEIVLSDTCLYLDSIMEFTTFTDSFTIYNTGCDTLFITDANNSLLEFSLSDTAGYLMPGDSVEIIVTFAPTSAGFFQDTVNIFNNDVDTSICLYGYAYLSPTISFNPDSFDVTLACGDSITLPLTIYNTGGSDLIFDIISTGSGSATPKVLVLHQGGSGVTVETELISTGRFIGSDIDILSNPATVTMANLAPYDVVLVWGGSTFSNPTQVGDTLKAFVDQGGGVVIATYSLSTPWALAGGIFDPGYSPFLPGGTQCVNGTINLGALPQPSHPIFENISTNPTYWSNCNYSNSPLNTGATLLASDLSGNRVVAENFPGNIVGIICYPNNLNLANAETKLMFANALYYVYNNAYWISLSSSTDTIIPGDSTIINVTFNTAGFNVGQYPANLIINSNDPLNPSDTVPTILNVIGAPEITFSDSCLYLDSIMEFTTFTDSFTIYNIGCDTLFITDANNSLFEFSLSDTSGYIVPGDSAEIIVTFAPTSVGFFQDTITIFNNDVDTSICLSGYGFARPVISTDPDSFDVTLACADTLILPLTIYNTGGSDLLFNITGAGTPNLDTILNRLNLNYTSVTSVIPSIYNFIDGVTGNNISDGGGDMYDGGNFLWTDLGGSFSYSDDVVVPSAWLGPTGQYFTRKNPGLFVFAADLDGVNWFEITGNLGADGSGNADATILSLSMYGTSFKGLVKRVFNAGDPSVNHLIIVEDKPLIDHTWAVNTNDDQHRITNLSSTNRIFYLLYASSGGGYINDAQTLNIMTEFLQAIGPFSDWISLSANSDTVVVGDSSVINVQFTSTGFNVGTYNTNLLIYSNDPLNSPVTLPVTMNVIGPPTITLSDTCLYLDSIMEFTTNSDTLWIYNTGCDTLFVTDINNSTPEYGVSDTIFTILPGDSALVTVTFTPVTVGFFQDTITLLNNDTDITVCLSGYGFGRPIISTDPDSFDVALNGCCDSVIVPLTIYNTGASYLVWNAYALATLTDDFDPVIDGSIWSFYNGFESTNCGSVSGNALYFDFNGSRNAATIDLDVSNGGTIEFYLEISNGGGLCEDADPGENIVLEYSTNGGGFYTIINTYLENAYPTFTYINEAIPPAAQTTSTRFRWRQLSNSGTCCDHWSLDDISIVYSSGVIILSPPSDTTAASDSSIVNITFNGCNLLQGTYSESIIIMSNDPLNSQVVLYVTVTKDTLPPTPFASDTAICFGDITPTFIATGDTSTGDTILWYSDPALTILVDTGDTFTPGDIAVGVYTYYLTLMVDSCQSLPDSVILTINTGPGAPVAIDTGSCFGDPVPSLIATGGTLIQWYNDAGLTNLVFIGDTFPTGDIAVGVYLYYATDSVAGCSPGPSDTVTLTISSLPAAPVASDTAVCEGDTVPNLIATGTNISWYDDAALTIFLFSGDTFTTGDTLAGVYTYYATQTPVGCESTADTVTLTINATPPPTSSDTTICFGDPTLDLIAVGSNIQWYSDIALTVLEFSGDTFTSGDVAVGVYVYYATQTLNGCESPAVTVTLTINTGPAAPSTADTTICFGDPTPDLTATGTYLQWYDDPGLTNLVFTGSPFATGEILAGTYIYYVTDSITGCPEGPSDTVTLTINAIPSVPISSDTTICFGNPTPDLSATGSNILWYSDPGLITLVFSGNPFASGDVAVGGYTYYATQTVNNCESPAVTVTLTINGIPSTPVSSDSTICFGDPTPDLTAPGTYIQWYDDGGLTNLVFTGSPYATGETAVGTYTYYVTDSVTGCPQSLSDTVTITINALPSIPVGADTTICFGDTVPDLIAAGDSIRWYSDPGLATLVFSGDTFATGDSTAGVYTYYATQTDLVTLCEGPADTVILTINATSAPLASNIAICSGDPVPDLTATGSNIQWYSDSLLDTLVFTGSPFATGDTAAGIYTYYVSQTLNNCESPATTVTLSINAGPSPTSTADTAACFGDPTPDLIAAGTYIQWYDDGALTNLVFSGDTFATGETTVNVYTYYVTDSVPGCAESLADTVILTIYAIPPAPTASDTASCFGDPTPDLVAAGTNIQWYSDPGLTLLVFAGNPFASGDTAVGTYTYYATQTINNCESPGTTVTLTINAIPATPSSSDTTICVGDPTPDLTATGTNIKWYDDAGLTNLVFTGSSFATGDAAIGVYIYYVTDSIAGCTSPPNTVTLTIGGLPLITLSDTCIDLGSAIEFTTNTDTLLIFNTGCDTLFITNITNSSSEFGVDTTSLTILPGNTGLVIVSFSPTSDTSFTDTLNIFSNDVDVSVCLSGTGLGAPVIAVNPDTFNVSFTGCCDSTILPLTIYNNGSAGANDLLFAVSTDSSWLSFSIVADSVPVGDSSVVNVTFNGCVLTPGIYTANITISSNDPLNPSDTVFIIVVKDALPSSPAASDTAICFGNPTPDMVAVGTGDSILWYSDPALTIWVFTGDTFATGETAVGAYTYYITSMKDGCEGLSDSVTLAINTPPSAPVVADTSVCYGYPTPDLVVSGTFVKWYSDAGLTISIFSGDTFPTGDTAVGSTTYYVTDSTGGCPASPADSVTLTIIPTPAAPVASSDTTICFGDPTPDLIATGAYTRWYDDPGLASLVFTGDTFVTGDTAAGIYTYYVTQTDTLVNNCESFADTVVLTINANPLAPAVSDTTICFGNPTPDLIAAGTNIQWFDDPALTNLVFTGETFATGETSPGIYTYYITDSVSSCATSPADTVTLTINAISTTPAGYDTTICFGDPVPNLTVTGSYIQWYSDTGLTTLVFTGDTFSTGDSATGTYTYYVTDSTGGCPESSADTVTLTINTVPSPPLANDTTICFGDPTPDLTAAGMNIRWYSDPLLDTLVFSGDTFATGNTAASTYTYYVTQTDTLINNCESPADTVILIINPIPAAPAAIDTTACEGSPIPGLTAAGISLNWYSDTSLTVLEFSGDTFATGQTVANTYIYYVTQTVSGCESPADTSVLTIMPTPLPPTAPGQTGCEGSAIPDLTATGIDIKWYSDPGLTNLVNTGSTYATGETAAGIYTYYVTDSLPQCVSAATTVTLTINSIPSAPATTDTTICSGTPTPDLIATGTNPQWYSDPTLILLINTGNTYTTGETSVGIYIYYVTDLVAGCGESPSDTITLTINPSPLVTLNTYAVSVDPGDSVELIAYNAITYTWSPAAGLNTTTGASVWASPDTTTTYTVTGTNDLGCSNSASVIIDVKGTGIYDFSILENLSIYPNPTRNEFIVEFTSAQKEPVVINLRNTLGQIMVTREAESRKGHRFIETFNARQLLPGLYHLEIITKRGIINRKVVVNR